MVDYNVWFTADLHIGHKNILKHQKQRIDKMSLSGDEDIKGHDNFIIDMWQSLTEKKDHIYVLGDFIMKNKEEAIKILNILKDGGRKIHLIVGNHDKSTKKVANMFESVDEIKSVIFKSTNYSFLKNDFNVVMCHYPMKTWQNKCRGAMQLYGHVHSNSPWIDEEDDLCLNVGLDNPICDYKLISLESVYEYYLHRLNNIDPKEYSDEITKINNKYIR